MAGPILGSFCEFCGDEGGAASMIICDNTPLGCLGGRHLYCTVPISTQLPAAEWLCDFCTAAVSAAARARQRDEDEEAARDANKRQRGAPPPAAQAAAHDTLARLEESLLRNADTRGELADTRELMVDELARFKAAARNKVSADHGLARCRAGGVLWAGRLSFVVQGAASELALVAYPCPASNPLSAEAARTLPEALEAAQFCQRDEFEIRDADVCKEACLLLAASAQAGAAGVSRLRAFLLERNSMLRVDLHRDDGLFLLLAPVVAEAEALFGLLAEPLQREEWQPGRQRPSRGILGGAGQPAAAAKPLRWADGSVDDRVAQCELPPGCSYSAPRADVLPPAKSARALVQKAVAAAPVNPAAASSVRPLDGLRVALVGPLAKCAATGAIRKLGAYVIRYDCEKQLQALRPECQDLLVVESNWLSCGLESQVHFEILPHLATPVHVFHGAGVLEVLARERRMLTAAELRSHDCLVFPRGVLLVTDVRTMQSLPPADAAMLFAELEARDGEFPGGTWRIAMHPDDLFAWELAVERAAAEGRPTSAAGGANLMMWHGSRRAGALQPGEISNSSDANRPALLRHATKAAHNLRATCRHVFLMASDERLLQASSITVLVGPPAEALQLLKRLKLEDSTVKV